MRARRLVAIALAAAGLTLAALAEGGSAVGPLGLWVVVAIGGALAWAVP